MTMTKQIWTRSAIERRYPKGRLIRVGNARWVYQSTETTRRSHPGNWLTRTALHSTLHIILPSDSPFALSPFRPFAHSLIHPVTHSPSLVSSIVWPSLAPSSSFPFPIIILPQFTYKCIKLSGSLLISIRLSLCLCLSLLAPSLHLTTLIDICLVDLLLQRWCWCWFNWLFYVYLHVFLLIRDMFFSCWRVRMRPNMDRIWENLHNCILVFVCYHRIDQYLIKEVHRFHDNNNSFVQLTLKKRPQLFKLFQDKLA